MDEQEEFDAAVARAKAFTEDCGIPGFLIYRYEEIQDEQIVPCYTYSAFDDLDAPAPAINPDLVVARYVMYAGRWRRED